jgi:Fe-S oxidoreductase
VVSANPGCALHLAAGGMLVEHPVQVLERLTRQEGADHGR